MKITLEFENLQDFFEELPRFTKLVNFSGKFATFTVEPHDDQDVTLDDPALPEVERTAKGVKVHAKGDPEVREKIEQAIEANEALSDKAPEPKPEVKDTDVRKALSKLIKAGKRGVVKEILDSFGVDNLTKLDKKHYGEALAKAEEALGDG